MCVEIYKCTRGVYNTYSQAQPVRGVAFFTHAASRRMRMRTGRTPRDRIILYVHDRPA